MWLGAETSQHQAKTTVIFRTSYLAPKHIFRLWVSFFLQAIRNILYDGRLQYQVQAFRYSLKWKMTSWKPIQTQWGAAVYFYPWSVWNQHSIFTRFSWSVRTPCAATSWYCLCFKLLGNFLICRTAVEMVSRLSSFLASDGEAPGSRIRRQSLPFFFCSKPTTVRLWPAQDPSTWRQGYYYVALTQIWPENTLTDSVFKPNLGAADRVVVETSGRSEKAVCCSWWTDWSSAWPTRTAAGGCL